MIKKKKQPLIESEYTFKSYLFGFFLSVILTIIPFFLIMQKKYSYSPFQYKCFLFIFAILQFFVHSVFFLHLNIKKKGMWNFLVFIFTIFVIFILVFGSIWIIHNMNYNMLY